MTPQGLGHKFQKVQSSLIAILLSPISNQILTHKDILETAIVRNETEVCFTSNSYAEISQEAGWMRISGVQRHQCFLLELNHSSSCYPASSGSFSHNWTTWKNLRKHQKLFIFKRLLRRKLSTIINLSRSLAKK